MVLETVTISKKEYNEYLKLKKIHNTKKENLESDFTLAGGLDSEVENYFYAQKEVADKNE